MTKRLLLIGSALISLVSCTTLDTMDIAAVELSTPRDSSGSILETKEFVKNKKKEVDKTVASGPIIQAKGLTSLEQKKRLGITI